MRLSFLFFPFIGGFAFVFVAQDNASGKEYALKVRCKLIYDRFDYFKNSLSNIIDLIYLYH